MAVFSGNGSAASPSFTFSSDTDLGMYRAAADRLGFAAGGGVGKLFIDENGRIVAGGYSDVFIGATVVSLDVANSLSINGANSFGLPGGGDTATLYFHHRTTSSINGQVGGYIQSLSTNAYTTGVPNNYDADLVFASCLNGNNTERLRITSNGRVTIGVIASPSYQLQLSSDSAGKPSTNTWTIVSDERIKEEIELADLDICYDVIKNIPLKRFKWKDEVYTEEQVPDRHKIGWIAQDVEAIFPKAVRIHEFKYQVFEETVIPAVEEELDDEGNVITPAEPERIEKGELISEEVIDDCRDLNVDQLYAAMYGAIQKLIAKVEALETEVAALKAS